MCETLKRLDVLIFISLLFYGVHPFTLAMTHGDDRSYLLMCRAFAKTRNHLYFCLKKRIII